jgi:hypothetical protein
MVKQLFLGALALLVACGAPKNSDNNTQSASPVVEGATIELMAVPQTGGASINEALWARKSSRDFTREALTLEELSGVIWAAAGINRPESSHLTAPSALGLYPIRTYAFLAEGVYLYNPATHCLERVVEGDHRPLTAMQEFANEAALNLVFVADLSVYDGKNIPMEKAKGLCGLDAAGYVENANLYAAAHGLKAITRGSYKEAELLALLGLDPATHCVALAQTIGK